ncbi:MAG: hypothetical protein ACI9GB_003371, partial [Halioglobus sp.]
SRLFLPLISTIESPQYALVSKINPLSSILRV